MQLRDTGLAFSPVTIVLHWLAAALVFALLALALVQACSDNPTWVQRAMSLQALLALVLFPLSAYRLWARLRSHHPLPIGTPDPVQVIVARSVALAMLLATVLLPVAAWLALSAADRAIVLPGGYRLPQPIAPDEGLARVFTRLFQAGTVAFLAGLALHIVGAARNHFVLRNQTLHRMLGRRVEL